MAEKKNSIIYTNSGNALQPSYKRVYSEEKRRFITIQDGEVNITEYIQKSNSLTDLAMLRKRYELTGELPNEGGYDGVDKDLTYLPSNIHELYNIKKDLEARFFTLDSGLQEAFGGVDNFVSSFMDGSAQGAIEKYYKTKAFEDAQKAAAAAADGAGQEGDK